MRRTYEQKRGGVSRDAFSNIELVIVSHSPFQAGGPKIVVSPREALHHLERRSFDTALVGGGAQLDSSFLAQGLVDEIYLNIYPAVVSKGINLALGGSVETGLQLIDSFKPVNNIIQLHYRVEKESGEALVAIPTKINTTCEYSADTPRPIKLAWQDYVKPEIVFS
jgi:dihydrofolate reductase